MTRHRNCFSGLLFVLASLSLATGVSLPASAQTPVGTPMMSASPAGAPTAAATNATPEAAGNPAAPTVSAMPVVASGPVTIETDDLGLLVDPMGGCLRSVRLKRFHNGHPQADAAAGGQTSQEPVELLDGYLFCRALGFKVGKVDLRKAPATVERVSQTEVRVTQTQGPLEIVRTITLEPTGYKGSLRVSMRNTGDTAQVFDVGFELGAASEYKDAGGLFAPRAVEYRDFALLDENGKVTRETLKFEKDPTAETVLTREKVQPEWLGTGSIYFLFAILPRDRSPLDVSLVSTGFNVQKNRQAAPDRTVYEGWATVHPQIAPHGAVESVFDLYMGPKSRHQLDDFSQRNLSKAIDYGFFRTVAWPMYYILDFLHGLIGNWGFAIIVLTIVINLVFYPLNVRAYLAGKKVQALQPELNALKEKFKDDKQKQQQESMALMAQRGANPLSGCLPILPQIPVFFGLNSVLTHTFELRQAPFLFWIQDLSIKDPFYISPVLMALLMFLQQRLTPMPSVDPAQQKMLRFMPILFAGFMLAYPSGLVLYIITNAVFSLLRQQLFMHRYKDVATPPPAKA